jgi:ABC-type Na+ transport system ATPase subunit NatA
LTTLMKPDEGSAEVCGFNVMQQPEQVREVISLTGQYAAVDDILTGQHVSMFNNIFKRGDSMDWIRPSTLAKVDGLILYIQKLIGLIGLTYSSVSMMVIMP